MSEVNKLKSQVKELKRIGGMLSTIVFNTKQVGNYRLLGEEEIKNMEKYQKEWDKLVKELNSELV